MSNKGWGMGVPSRHKLFTRTAIIHKNIQNSKEIGAVGENG